MEKSKKAFERKKEAEAKRVRKLEEKEKAQEKASKEKSKKIRKKATQKIHAELKSAKLKAKKALHRGRKEVAAARKQVKELKHKIAKTDGEGFKAPSPNFNIHKAEASMSQAKGRMKKAILAQKRAKLYA